MLDFEHEDRIIPMYILEQIYIHRDEYLPSEDSYKNMQRILRVNERYVLTKEIIERYLSMDCGGSFITILNQAIKFFETIYEDETNS